MDLNLKIVPLEIEGLDDSECRKIEDRLQGILKSWEGTPHLGGQQSKGQAVDCVRFVSAVIDELYDTVTDIARLPQDVAFHDAKTAFGAFRTFMEKYPHTKVDTCEIQPGDLLVTGTPGGGPGHAIIAGTKYLWHCDSYSVVPTGTHLTSGGVYFLKTILRGADRHLWVR